LFQALLSQENIMKWIILSSALVGLMGAVACPAYAVQAGANTGAHATTGYASQLPAIYPTETEQQGMWGSAQLVRCPENYGLVFDLSPVAEGAKPKPPVCKPIPASVLSGGAQ